MARTADRLAQLRAASTREAARLVYRKAFHRRVRMGRYGFFARDALAPKRTLELPIELWGPDRYDDVYGTNEYLSADDMAHFHRQRSTCIVVLDGDRIAASSWMTSGDVSVPELGRTVPVPEGEHFSCRSWVSPDHRGKALFSHMIYAYAESIDPDDEVWGFVYYWNVASIRSLANIGWQFSGEYWTRYLLTRRSSGHTRCAPRPAFEGDDVFVP